VERSKLLWSNEFRERRISGIGLVCQKLEKGVEDEREQAEKEKKQEKKTKTQY
jgi:hypothetical protein